MGEIIDLLERDLECIIDDDTSILHEELVMGVFRNLYH